jgi:hypothetical protein
MGKKVKAGTKIVPNMGSLKGQTLTVKSIAKVQRGSKQIGTRTGQTIYFAVQKNYRIPIMYRRKDFSIKRR